MSNVERFCQQGEFIKIKFNQIKSVCKILRKVFYVTQRFKGKGRSTCHIEVTVRILRIVELSVRVTFGTCQLFLCLSIYSYCQ